MFAADHCVILDGATGTELSRADDSDYAVDERLWGTRALIERGDVVLAVHRQYVDAGCDVISTNTWGLASALVPARPPVFDPSMPIHWMDLARNGLRLARQAVSDGGRTDECAVAFSLNGDVDADEKTDILRPLARLFVDEAPDIILLETLSVVRPSLYIVVERLLETGIPVWLSFRRCRHGLCSVYGQHWGGPEGDSFERAAAQLEALGVDSLLVNCIPPDHVSGMVSYLRDFCDLPIGVYPNLGYYSSEGWRFEPAVGSAEYASMALGWREEGAQIIGGCCGVGPDEISAARQAVEGTKRGSRRPDSPGPEGTQPAGQTAGGEPWLDRRNRRLFPLAFPDLVCDRGVSAPQSESLLLWQYLHDEGIGARQRCLDVGSGTGILGIQLALNGATHIRAIDVDERAVNNTRTNAFRNGVADRVDAAQVDIFPWIPEERYEVIVGCLDQTPVDPFQQVGGHRPVDYWGRTPFDQLVSKLGEALAPDGVAYLTHLSILSQVQTDALLREAGLRARIVDYRVVRPPERLAGHMSQVRRVEALTDAYLLHLGELELLVAYVLEVRRVGPEGAEGSI